jgi:hypothetical protein
MVMTSAQSHPIDALLKGLVDHGVASTRTFLPKRKAALPGGKTALLARLCIVNPSLI